MNFLKNALIGLVVVGVISIFSSMSFAQEKEGAKIKILQDSAAALQQSKPTLSVGLTEFVNEEISEKQEKEEKNEVEEMKEPEAMQGYREAHTKLLKDAAAALQQSHPELAAELTKYADEKAKKMEEINAKQMNEKNEKEEPGEKVEPKNEQNENRK